MRRRVAASMSDTPSHGVAVITGGSSGIGRATGLLFADKGWAVGLIARNESGLADVRKEIEARGGRAAVATADVADAAALDQAAERIEAELGPIDIWVNNAGAGFYAPFLDITEEEFRRVTETTYFGAVNGTRTALHRMQPRNRGSIVSVGSVAGYRGFPLQSPYCGAKFALRGFIESVRPELVNAGSKVHLGMVHPPSVNTPFFSHAGARMEGVPRPPPPVYQPEHVAEAIWLASTQRRRDVMVGAAGLGFAWSNKLLPGLMDRLIGWTGLSAQQSQDAEAQQRYAPALDQPSSGPQPARGHWGGSEVSPALWLTRNRGAVLAAIGVLGLAAGQRLRRSR